MPETITAQIQELARLHHENGGSPEAAVMTPAMARSLYSEWDPAMVRLTPGTSGGLSITELMTDYGGIRIMTSAYCPPDQIYIGDLEQICRMAEDTEKLFDRTE